MPRTKSAAPKTEKKVYPPGYFVFDADKGTRNAEEIIEFHFGEEGKDLRESPELKVIARNVYGKLTDRPKTIRAIAEELDMLGQQLPIRHVLLGMSDKGVAIGSVGEGFVRGFLPKT